MARDEIEVERKYDVDADTPLPSLDGAAGVKRVDPPVVSRLEATYFDTRDLTLVGAGITLRRRVGGADQGWHLKLPAVAGGGDAERRELHLPLARGIRTVPHEFRSLLDGVVSLAGDDNLRAVAKLLTTRTVRVLRGTGGAALAEVCDDTVQARGFRVLSSDNHQSETRWREWEVELVDGDEDLLDDVEALLLEAGARVGEHPSKLRRALGDAAPPPATTPADVDRAEAMPSPRQVVQARITEQARRIIALDPAVRRDSPDAVHQMRVAARRLRSALATYRPMLRTEETEPVREELRHLGRALSHARDLEVLDDRLTELLVHEGWDEHPFRHHLADELRLDREHAHATVLAHLSEQRHETLLARLRDLAEGAPWSDELDWSEVLARVRKDDKRVRRRMRAAAEAESRDDRLRLLHETRKAAKRLRYAAETLKPAFGSDAHRLAKSAKKLQSHLGDVQDAAVSRRRLRESASTAADTGVDSLPAGALWAREEETIEQLQGEVATVWKKSRRKKLRSWLSG